MHHFQTPAPRNLYRPEAIFVVDAFSLLPLHLSLGTVDALPRDSRVTPPGATVEIDSTRLDVWVVGSQP